MLATVVLFILCLLLAVAAVPLILKVVPRNEYFGVVTERARSREDIWYEVNRFAGWAVVAATLGTVLALVIWSNTVLRPFWCQLLLFVALGATAAGATFWYERYVERHPPKRRPRRRASSSGARA